MQPAHAIPPIAATSLKAACSSCTLRELCLPVALDAEEVARLDTMVSEKRSVRRGDALFRAGDTFTAIYAVRTGFFKKIAAGAADGREQVTGFLMAGELMGFDGIGADRHTCDAVALEDSQVCVIPFGELESLSRDFIPLQRQLHRIMSREIIRDQGILLLLGTMTSEERVAAFLLNLTTRLQARGFSSSELVLRMTREEIGSYLGLKVETVSRAFSRLQDAGLILARQRQVQITDEAGLRALISHIG